MIHGYECFLVGNLDPIAPAILIRYQDKFTFTDTLTTGMKLKTKTVKSLKFVNVNGVDEEFSVELHQVVLPQQGRQNIAIPTTVGAVPVV